MSKTDKQQLVTATVNQGGGTVTSSKFHQQSAIGEGITGTRISSSRFHLVPGFLGASFSQGTVTAPVSELDMRVLYAKTDSLGFQIQPKTWQTDNTPFFIWEVPATGLDLAGYSYVVDGVPDDIVDTTATSFDVSTSVLKQLADGQHTFSVKAINTAGHSGKPISMELWVDTTPPQVTMYSPNPGTLLNVAQPSISATLSDPNSGVDESSLRILVNGSAASSIFNKATGVVTSTGGAWKEGANSLQLAVADAAGNTQAPLLWSVTRDTTPPTGTITINGGAHMTTSVSVTLGLDASDGPSGSGVTRMLLSNEELSGYVEEPYVSVRALWSLNPIRGLQRVYVKFVDKAGNVSAPIEAQIDLALLSPETVITSGPAGFAPERAVSFTFMCPEGGCVYSYAFDNEAWSAWSAQTTATKSDLAYGNHYFRVKAAKEVNGHPEIQLDEEDPSPAQRMWIVGVEPHAMIMPKGPPIKLWRLE